MEHWTEQDFKEWLYGLKDADGHLSACDDCRTESRRLLQLRSVIQSEPEVSYEFLAAQRRAILARLDEPARPWLRARVWGPISAGVALASLAVSLLIPKPKPAQPLFSHSDEQFFQEISSMEQSNEPRAIEPVHNLFQE